MLSIAHEILPLHSTLVHSHSPFWPCVAMFFFRPGNVHLFCSWMKPPVLWTMHRSSLTSTGAEWLSVAGAVIFRNQMAVPTDMLGIPVSGSFWTLFLFWVVPVIFGHHEFGDLMTWPSTQLTTFGQMCLFVFKGLSRIFYAPRKHHWVPNSKQTKESVLWSFI